MENLEIENEYLFRYGNCSISEYINKLKNLNDDDLISILKYVTPNINIFRSSNDARYFALSLTFKPYHQRLNLLFEKYKFYSCPLDDILNNDIRYKIFTTYIIISLYVIYSRETNHPLLINVCQIGRYLFNIDEEDLNKGFYLVHYTMNSKFNNLCEVSIVYLVTSYLMGHKNLDTCVDVMRILMNYKAINIRETLEKLEPNDKRLIKKIMMNIRLGGD